MQRMQVCMYVRICSWMDVVTAGESLEYFVEVCCAV